MEPQVIIQDSQGRHNADLTTSANRLIKANSSKELSTVCVIPNPGVISVKMVEKWFYLIPQMNQKFVRLPVTGLEKHAGFNFSIEQILATPGLNTFKYLLTMEDNILPPPDGLVRLYENIEKYDVVGGLAWTKGIEGYPMLYGHPHMIPLSFTPVMPFPDTIQECVGLGTGFTLFKLDIFKDPRVPKPWFRTQHKFQPDMYFFENIHKLGYKIACDTRIKIGNFDMENDIVW